MSGAIVRRHSAACRQAVSSTHWPIATIRPVSSATGMNSAGDSGPSSGLVQRNSASAPTVRPLRASTTGWYASRSASDEIARRSDCSIAKRRCSRRFSCAVKNVKWLRPRCFASYIAESALRISVAASSPSRGATLMPIDTPSQYSLFAISNGFAIASITSRASAASASGSSQSSTRITNSSPPTRVSAWRPLPHTTSRAATLRSSASPASWPAVSLTFLKPSRSMNSTATRAGPATGSRLPNSSRIRSDSQRRLYRPVSASRVAR